MLRSVLLLDPVLAKALKLVHKLINHALEPRVCQLHVDHSCNTTWNKDVTVEIGSNTSDQLSSVLNSTEPSYHFYLQLCHSLDFRVHNQILLQ